MTERTIHQHVEAAVRDHLRPDLPGRVLRAAAARRASHERVWPSVVALLGTLVACSVFSWVAIAPRPAAMTASAGWQQIMTAAATFAFHP